jgi:hypothetical protein
VDWIPGRAALDRTPVELVNVWQVADRPSALNEGLRDSANHLTSKALVIAVRAPFLTRRIPPPAHRPLRDSRPGPMHQHLPLLAKSSKRLLNAPQLGAILGYRRTLEATRWTTLPL